MAGVGRSVSFVNSAGQPPTRATDCLPHSQPQRTQTSLAVDPEHDNVVYVGLEQDGFFKSIDGGTTWVTLVDGIRSEPKASGDGLCHGEFYSTVIAPQDPHRICTAQNARSISTATAAGMCSRTTRRLARGVSGCSIRPARSAA